MADLIPNVAKGRVAYYGSLPQVNDAVILVLIQDSGVEADDTLIDYTNLASLLAASNNEATFTGYARRTLTTVTVTIDNTSNTVTISADDPAGWTNTGSDQLMAKAVICYDDDTTGGTDTNLIPMAILDYTFNMPSGVPIIFEFGADGIAVVS
jgi:hypothetical protein